jgi:hypothetical protein
MGWERGLGPGEDTVELFFFCGQVQDFTEINDRVKIYIIFLSQSFKYQRSSF